MNKMNYLNPIKGLVLMFLGLAVIGLRSSYFENFSGLQVAIGILGVSLVYILIDNIKLILTEEVVFINLFKSFTMVSGSIIFAFNIFPSFHSVSFYNGGSLSLIVGTISIFLIFSLLEFLTYELSRLDRIIDYLKVRTQRK